MWQLFIASFCDQTEIEGNGRNNNNKTTWQMARSLSKQALLKLNKFEVSKIYMTACMCIYKFCQTKEYLFMIFFCFIQKPEGYFYDSSWFFMFYSRSWMFYYTVRPRDTRPRAARTFQVHVFELGPKKFEMNEFMKWKPWAARFSDHLAFTLLSNKSCTNFELHEFFLSPKNVHLKASL